jgi:hypothetical protein
MNRLISKRVPKTSQYCKIHNMAIKSLINNLMIIIRIKLNRILLNRSLGFSSPQRRIFHRTKTFQNMIVKNVRMRRITRSQKIKEKKWAEEVDKDLIYHH